MNPIDIAEELDVVATESLLISVSRRLVVALVLLVFGGVGVLTFNVYLVKQQVEHITQDLSELSATVHRNGEKLTQLEYGYYRELERRIERIEQFLEREHN